MSWKVDRSVKDMVNKDERITIQEIAEVFDISSETCIKHFEWQISQQHGLSCVILHILTPEKKTVRVA